jgi:hypothetical protein
MYPQHVKEISLIFRTLLHEDLGFLKRNRDGVALGKGTKTEIFSRTGDRHLKFPSQSTQQP